MTQGPGSTWRWVRGRRAGILLLVAVLAGFGFRLLAQDETSLHSSDSYHYLLLATHLVAGDGFVSGGSQHPDLSRPPLYPLLVAAAHLLVPAVEIAARLATAAFGALAAIPLFFMTRRLIGPGAALMVLPLAAFSCLAGGAVRLLPTSLATLLVLTALSLTLAAANGRRLLYALLAGLTIGLSALARSEGFLWPPLLALWLLAAPTRSPLAWKRRLAAALLVVVCSLAVYAPYVAWASARLNRLDPVPQMTYMAQMRDLSDRLGLRWVDEGRVPWQERAKGLLSRDHQHLVLRERFEHSREVEPDMQDTAVEVADPPLGEEPATADIILRRLQIATRNTVSLQRAVRYGHFAPAVLLLLLAAGLPTLLAPRHRPAALFLILALAGSLVPMASHVERRFLYVAFALALIPSAAGWRTLVRLAGRATLRPRLVQGVLSLGLLALVTGAGIVHYHAQQRPAAVMQVLNEAARQVRSGPQGAVLGVQPAIAYRSGRAYRVLPVAPPAATSRWGHSQGASQLVIEGERDLQLRPDLQDLVLNGGAEGYRLAWSTPDPRGGKVWIFHLDTVPPVAPSTAGTAGSP